MFLFTASIYYSPWRETNSRAKVDLFHAACTNVRLMCTYINTLLTATVRMCVYRNPFQTLQVDLRSIFCDTVLYVYGADQKDSYQIYTHYILGLFISCFHRLFLPVLWGGWSSGLLYSFEEKLYIFFFSSLIIATHCTRDPIHPSGLLVIQLPILYQVPIFSLLYVKHYYFVDILNWV